MPAYVRAVLPIIAVNVHSLLDAIGIWLSVIRSILRDARNRCRDYRRDWSDRSGGERWGRRLGSLSCSDFLHFCCSQLGVITVAIPGLTGIQIAAALPCRDFRQFGCGQPGMITVTVAANAGTEIAAVLPYRDFRQFGW